MRYHHCGIPVPTLQPGMTYLPAYDVACTDHQDSPFGLQFMHYGPGCSIPEVVQQKPHLAFEVEDLDAALQGQVLLIAPNSPSPGVRVAFIDCQGCPVELLEFTDPQHPDRGQSS